MSYKRIAVLAARPYGRYCQPSRPSPFTIHYKSSSNSPCLHENRRILTWTIFLSQICCGDAHPPRALCAASKLCRIGTASLLKPPPFGVWEISKREVVSYSISLDDPRSIPASARNL